MPSQQTPELSFGRRGLAGQAGSMPRDLSKLLIALWRDVRQRDLIDSQQVGQQLTIQFVGLAAPLYHGAKSQRMGQ